jgi:hypothetical protein
MKHVIFVFFTLVVTLNSAYGCPFCSGMYSEERTSSKTSDQQNYAYVITMRDLIGDRFEQKGFDTSADIKLAGTDYRCKASSTPNKSGDSGLTVNCTGTKGEEISFIVKCNSKPPEGRDYFKTKSGMASVLITAACLR